MRLWDLTGPEFDEADAEPWSGPRSMRPFTTRALVQVALAASALYFLAGVGWLLLTNSDPDNVRHPDLWIVVVLFCFGYAFGNVGYGLMAAPRIARVQGPYVASAMILSTPLLVSFLVFVAGPEHAAVVAAYVQAPIFAFYMFTRAWAVASTASVLVGFAVVILIQDGWSFAVWGWTAAAISGASVVIGLIAARANELADAEHQARVELADLNHHLAERVNEQVGEIERLGGLRRFLSPQIADAVVSGAVEEIGVPHRRRIAVLFCDLRGFTAFTNGAEPEEVIGVLDEYYRVVGGLLQRYDATIGDYAGDGIMAYFGDPVPRDDAAPAAVRMTLDVVRALTPVASDWKRRGYDLDFGVGLAYGYATLGVVGFDARHDYKPVGGVVNLAARLCAKARPGQVLLDHATYAETSGQFPSDPVPDLDLKGYGASVRAYALRTG
jgi:class 3 adenylate cyclase